MKKLIFRTYLFILFLFAVNSIKAQEDYAQSSVVDTFQINLNNAYSLSSVTIIPGSVEITLNDKLLLESEYHLSYELGAFTLSEGLNYSLFDTIYVRYKSYKIDLKKEYKRRSLIYSYSEVLSDSIRVSRLSDESLTTESIFGKGIEQSGTIVRGFTLGTNRDMTLNSGLRLQLSGKLSEDVEVIAALTDENTPIQPEGNTETLEELDKVFIEVKHKNAIGTFGDYDLNERIGEFGVIERKLQGLKGEVFYRNQSGVVALASSRGKNNTNQFNGIDGVQGPYRLSGIDNERNIIIIAGSEKVYIDGEEMRRGENNDYIIEYSNAQITFTPNRLITSASRITVDFEYTDRRYQRNFFGTNVKTNLFDDKLNVKIGYLREGDDQDNPIDLSLSDDDKNILQNAGDDRNAAVVSGASLAVPDSNGTVIGIYTKIDTTINGNLFSYYVYNPGASQSRYNVVFTYVGELKGDYIKRSIGKYEFVGIGRGAYLPIKFLPLPNLRQMSNIVINSKILENVTLNLELAGSSWDKNRLSNLGDDDNLGYARNFTLKVDPSNVKIGSISLGKVGGSYRDRFIEDRYTSLDRINTIEFNRDYNIEDDGSNNEALREFTLNLIPVEELTINSKYGFLSRGEKFESNRYLTNVNLFKESVYDLKYDFDYVNTISNNLKSDWIKQKGNGSFTIGYFNPGLEYLSELKKDRTKISDSLRSGSLKYFEIAPYINLLDLNGFSANIKYSVRDESYPLEGVLEKESRAETKQLGMEYGGLREFSSSLTFTQRNKYYTDKYKKRGLLDNETILIRSQSRTNLFDRFVEGDLFYEVTTQRSAQLEKVFVRVPYGSGNYLYLGDLNNNGIQDEEEFELTSYDGEYILTTLPTDELFPVIDLKTSTRWKFDFEKVISDKSILGLFLNPISTETFWRVEENSKLEDTKKIYLLNFSYFQNDSTTIKGSNYLQQDLFLFENDRELSFRFRFAQRKNLNQFAGGLERGFFRERSVRIRFKMVEEINNQTEIINQQDNASAPVNLNRSRLVTSNDVVSDFSYRPVRNIEVGFKFKVGKSTDEFPDKPTIINTNVQTLRFTFSFAGKGRLRLEAERNELEANTSANLIPFEITKGNAIGKNYFWRLNFDYRISGNLQTSLNYDGRKQGGSKVIHTMRAEARAYF